MRYVKTTMLGIVRNTGWRSGLTLMWMLVSQLYGLDIKAKAYSHTLPLPPPMDIYLLPIKKVRDVITSIFIIYLTLINFLIKSNSSNWPSRASGHITVSFENYNFILSVLIVTFLLHLFHLFMHWPQF